jgi:hypothetical protein
MSEELDSFDKDKIIAALRHVALFKFDYYDRATEQTIVELNNELREDVNALAKLERDMPDVDENNYRDITDEEWGLIDDYSNLHMNVGFNQQHLLSLLEMKIVYLFKSLEVVMKRMIQIAYPKANTKDFYQWDSMKTFFKSNSIEISNLEGYNECTDLRKVNNAIKHNGVINDEIKKIADFSNQTEFDHLNLESFHQRVKPKVEVFTERLTGEIERNLFDFPIERLEALVKNYSERMDENTLETFVSLLEKKLPNRINQIDDMSNNLPF